MPTLSFVVFKPPGQDVPYLTPSTALDVAPLRRTGWRHGDVVTVEFNRPRSGPRHRLVMGMLRFVHENQERFETFEELRAFLALQTSFVIEVIDRKTGEIQRVPRSWSYAEMDELEFAALHEELVPIILGEFYHGKSREWLKRSMNYQAFLDGLMGFCE